MSLSLDGTRQTLVTSLKKSYSELNKLREKYDLKTKRNNITALHSVLGDISEESAIIIPITTSKGTVVFVLSSECETVSGENVLFIDHFDNAKIDSYLGGDAHDNGWLKKYLSYRSNNSLLGRGIAFEKWKKSIYPISERLWFDLLKPISEHIKELGITKVLFVLSGELQVLPVTSARYLKKEKYHYFADEFQISFLPSLLSFSALRGRKSSQKSSSLIIGVGDYKYQPKLNYATHEAQVVGKIFNTVPILDTKASRQFITKNISDKAYFHFAGHGLFAWGNEPLSSALILLNKEKITLAEVLVKMDLSGTMLVTLSACETGLIDLTRSPDEFIGFQTGFIHAGCANVLSSLWTVDDFSTAILMNKFYQLHIAEKLPIPISLHKAQCWIRKKTRREIGEYVINEMPIPHLAKVIAYADIMNGDLDQKVYEHPYYWAAFTITGI